MAIMAAVAARDADRNPEAAGKPFFILTVDTEGDDLWSRPREITTRNAEYLPRFQSLCEAYGLRPTYLTNYEMAVSPVFRELGRDVLRRGAAEIGMHLHAWNSPPLVPLTDDDFHHVPYLAEYPEPLIREKVRFMTDLLEETFGVDMVSHRAGRWMLSETYARILVEHGYRVDCSVTPHVSWRPNRGDPRGQGGSDYTLFPEDAYFLDLEDISRPGDSALLEVPLTILSHRRPLCRLLPSGLRSASLPRRAIDRLLPNRVLIPNRGNGKEMRTILDAVVRRRRPYAELAIHSSELMPGGSPTFRTEGEIETLYEDLEALFVAARGRFTGGTLAEYHRVFSAPH
jgi:hypothetical protein